MPLFPSLAWCREVARVANADPESIDAGSGWAGDLVVVFLPEAALPRGFAVYVRPEGGRLGEVRAIEDIEAADALGAAYVVKAPYSVWKGLLQGTLDPVEVVLRRHVVFSGDLTPILARVNHKGWIERAFARVATEFVDEPR